MKSMKKLVLVGLVLLASVIVLVGCDTNAGDTPSSTGGTTQQPGSEGTGGESANKAEDLTLTIGDASGSPMSVTLEDTDSDGYYEIGTADELYAFAAAVNRGKTTINGELTSSIEVNKTVLDEQGNLSKKENFRSWTPIGNGATPYTGTFDGADNTIKGLYFDDTNADYAGLFGYLGEGGSVQNLGVEDSYFCGRMYVGGVVGENWGQVNACYNTGSVRGTIEGYDCYVGGVVGFNGGDVSECFNEGSVTGEGFYCYVGGVVGANYQDSTVTDCYNTGDVSCTGPDCYVGGVVGWNSGAVSECFNEGAVSGTATGEGSACYVGGVVGPNDGDVSNCYNEGDVRGTSEGKNCYVGGVVGENRSDAAVTNCYNRGDVSGTVTGEISYCYVGGVVGANYQDSTVTDCYNTGDVTGEGTYCDVGGVVGSNSGEVTTCYSKGDISGTATYCYVGGVVGDNFGQVTTCYNTGDVRGIATGETASSSVGGVVGKNEGEVSNCYNEGAVSGTATYCSVGGVVGANYQDSTVTDCYNTGDVSGTAMHCSEGGVAGSNSGEVTTCYYLSGKATGGINGKDESGQAEAKDESFFEGEKMAELLNANQEDSPWEYIIGEPAPTLKVFNKG